MKIINALLFFLIGTAHAQQCTTLIYQGAPFSLLVTTGPNYSQIVPLSGKITLAAPLPANDTSVVTPVAWDFSSEYQYLTSVGPYNPEVSGPNSSFSFTTVNGVITAWTLSVLYNNGPGTVDHFSVIANSGLSGDMVTVNATNITSNLGATSITGSSNTSGTWTCESPPAVNPLSAPLAAAQAQVTALTAQVASLKAQLAAQTPATSSPSPAVAATPMMVAGTKGGGAFSWALLLVGTIPLTVRLRDRLRSG